MRQVLFVGGVDGLEVEVPPAYGPLHLLPQHLLLLLLLPFPLFAVALVDAGEEEGGAGREEAEERAEPVVGVLVGWCGLSLVSDMPRPDVDGEGGKRRDVLGFGENAPEGDDDAVFLRDARAAPVVGHAVVYLYIWGKNTVHHESAIYHFMFGSQSNNSI